MSMAVHSTLFALLSRRAAWLGSRHGVLAQNIANADTPGYRPLDLAPFERTLGRNEPAPFPGLARTNARHLPGRAPAPGVDPAAKRTGAYEIAPSGNAVVLEEQMEKLARTQLDHQLATSLYGRHIALLKTVLGTATG